MPKVGGQSPFFSCHFFGTAVILLGMSDLAETVQREPQFARLCPSQSGMSLETMTMPLCILDVACGEHLGAHGKAAAD